MSSLRALQRAPVWNPSQYVCLCCRQRLFAQQQQQQQRRAYASEAETAQVDDDWFSNFNNLYTEPLAQIDGFRKEAAPEILGPRVLYHGSGLETPNEKQRTRRQRIAERSITSDFASLRSNLEQELDSTNVSSDQNEQLVFVQSYQPFTPSDEPNAPHAPPAVPRRVARKRGSTRTELRFKPGVGVYTPSPVAPSAPTGRVRDPKFEAIIQELNVDFAAKMPQIIREMEKKKKMGQAQKSGGSNPPNVVRVISDTERSRLVNPNSSMEDAALDFPESARSMSPTSDSTSQLLNTSKVSGESGSKAKHNDGSNGSFADLIAGIAEQQQQMYGTRQVVHLNGSSALVRKTESSRPVFHTFNNGPLFRKPDSGPRTKEHAMNVDHSRQLRRDMSTTARRASTGNEVSSSTGPQSRSEVIPPWGITVSEGNSATKDGQPPKDNIDQMLGSLIRKKKKDGAQRASKVESKEKKAAKPSKSESNSKNEAKEKKVAKSPKSESKSEPKAKQVARSSRGEPKEKKTSGKKSQQDGGTKDSAMATLLSQRVIDQGNNTVRAVQLEPKKTKTKGSSKSESTEQENAGKKSEADEGKEVSQERDWMLRSRGRRARVRLFTTERNILTKILSGSPQTLWRKHSGGSSSDPVSRYRRAITNPTVRSGQDSTAGRLRRLRIRIHNLRSTAPLGERWEETAGEKEAANEKEAAGEKETTSEKQLTSEQERAQVLPLSVQDADEVASIEASSLEITPLNLSQPPVPSLQYGLDRALFNPGVVQLQDPHSRVYNFDPYLQKIMPVVEFDYNALKQYKTSSQDTALSDLAREHGKRYIGSTSSMTGTLGHFHYLISGFRPLNLKMLSRSFPDSLDNFTQINRAPNAIFLRNKGNGLYAIDADKEYDGPNVLMMLGKSMEKLLTLPKNDFERYKKGNSHSVTDDERTTPEAYEYTTMGGFLMRSQLDAKDSRLPGTGMFDLKTRAVVSIRMNSADYEPMTGYELQTLQGRFQSYEREYYDMMRSTMLKYMLQVRMGRMDGIFLAYHNVERIFGFQYVPLHEMDRAIHSQTDPSLGDQEFKLSLDLLNKALDKATAKFPDQSLRLHFESTEVNSETVMWIHAEPISENEINDIQSASQERTAEFERTMMGIEKVDSDQSADAETDVAAGGVKDTAFETLQSKHTVQLNGDAKAASGEEDREYLTTASDAAPQFSSKLESPRELKPLFSASVACKSRVNDSTVPRPASLKPTDKWELDYVLKEWPVDDMMWARYEDMRSRRKKAFEQIRKDNKEDEDQENGEPKKKDSYVEFLKSISQQSRARRERIDELEAGKEPVVVGQPIPSSEDAVERKIKNLDDYMAWLYR